MQRYKGSFSIHLAHEATIGDLLNSDPTVALLATLSGGHQAAPPLRFGKASLALFGRSDDWMTDGYLPETNIFLFSLDGATAHTEAGILVTARGQTVTDTLSCVGALTCVSSQPTHLPGTWLSLLLGNVGNYFHFLLLGLARLAILTPEWLRGLSGVLLPEDLGESRRDMIDRALALANGGHRLSCAWRELGVAEAVQPDRLLLPWNVANSPALGFLRRLTPSVPRPWRRLYIDRRASSLRPLVEETDVVAALTARGFEAVRLETLRLDQQATLFAEAELVVGAHGAGLANLAFAAPGTRVVEIMPDEATNWCYRVVAAQAGLQYDCLLSRSMSVPGQDGYVAPHRVALDHLLAAIA